MQGFNEQKKGALAAGDIESQQADAEAKIRDSALPEAEKRRQTIELRNQYLDRTWQDWNAKAMKTADDIGKMKVDPQQYIKNMGDGDKVLNIISMALGGLDAAANHHENWAAQALDKSIDRNIDAQKEAIQNAKGNLELKNNLVADIMKHGYDLNQAGEMAANMHRQEVQDTLQAQAAHYGSPLAKARALSLSGQIDTSKGETVSKLANDVSQRATAGVQRQGAVLDNQIKQQQFANEQMVKNAFAKGDTNTIAQFRPDLAVKLPNGQTAVTRLPEDAKAAKDIIEAGVPVKNALQDLKKASLVEGVTYPGTAAHTAYNEARNRVKAAQRVYLKVRGTGDSKGGEESIGAPESMLDSLSGGDISVVTPGRVRENIDNLITHHEDDMQSKLGVHGVTYARGKAF